MASETNKETLYLKKDSIIKIWTGYVEDRLADFRPYSKMQ